MSIKVTNEFIEIYRSFSALNVVSKIEKLSEREKYLLLIISLDEHISEDNAKEISLDNFKSFSDEYLDIYKMIEEEETSNEILKSLCEETKSNTVSISIVDLVDSDGNSIPPIYTLSDIRNINIDNILD